MLHEIENPSLIAGLEKSIELAKVLPHDKQFIMSSWSCCVIGVCFFYETNWSCCVFDVLKSLFGITFDHALISSGKIDPDLMFSSDSGHYYTQKQWKVIHLFTSAIDPNDDCVCVEEWLKLAEKVLEEIK